MSSVIKQRLLERKLKLQHINNSILATSSNEIPKNVDPPSIVTSSKRNCAFEPSSISETVAKVARTEGDATSICVEKSDDKDIWSERTNDVTFVEDKRVLLEEKRTLNCETATKWTLPDDKKTTCDNKWTGELSLQDLLGAKSTKQKECAKMSDEIHQLLSKRSAKEMALIDNFKSDGSTMKEFCRHGTRADCARQIKACTKLHFKKIIQQHTDKSLGDCSFLNTCFHMDTCKYIHYKVDYSSLPVDKRPASERTRQASVSSTQSDEKVNTSTDAIKKNSLLTHKSVLYPSQWIQCDMRFFDLSIVGKFSVIMADPPWDIHMELPYGTMADDEMRRLNIPALQDDGFIFLWVTGRAMELARECLKLWGYKMVDEIIWVKTNQLQRIIRTGRTGHWLNHGKEHCLVGLKGAMNNYVGRGLDCDVIVSEVRETSHKPDEIYGIIERLSPGTRKIELFGRQHNAQPNWITLGNQLDGVHLWDQNVVARFTDRYPDKNCMPTQADINSHKLNQIKQQHTTQRRQFY